MFVLADLKRTSPLGQPACLLDTQFAHDRWRALARDRLKIGERSTATTAAIRSSSAAACNATAAPNDTPQLRPLSAKLVYAALTKPATN